MIPWALFSLKEVQDDVSPIDHVLLQGYNALVAFVLEEVSPLIETV